VPGDAGYQYQVAVILENLGRTEEARKAAERIRNSSSDLRAADKASDLIAQISQPHSSASSPTKPAPAPAASTDDRQVHLERKTEPDDRPAATASSRTAEANAPPSAAAPLPAAPVVARVYSMVGTITDVSCTDAPQVQITLKAQTIVMHLHAADVGHLTIKPTPGKNSVCQGLRGRSARVTYQLVSEQKWDGEIQAVELRDTP
jgi:hypothetical protein